MRVMMTMVTAINFMISSENNTSMKTIILRAAFRFIDYFPVARTGTPSSAADHGRGYNRPLAASLGPH